MTVTGEGSLIWAHELFLAFSLPWPVLRKGVAVWLWCTPDWTDVQSRSNHHSCFQ